MLNTIWQDFYTMKSQKCQQFQLKSVQFDPPSSNVPYSKVKEYRVQTPFKIEQCNTLHNSKCTVCMGRLETIIIQVV